MTTPRHLIVILFTFFLLVNSLYSQGINKLNYRTIDSILFNNDLLVNGTFYFESNPYASGTSYFLSDNWQKCWLILEGIKFENVQYKLDVIKDELVLKHKNSEYDEVMIELNPSLVDSFMIGNHLFVSNNSLKIDKNFLELIYDGEQLKFYKTHQKFFKKVYNTNTPYGQITNDISANYLFINNNLVKINNKRELLGMLSKSKRKKINTFLKKNKIKYNRATNNDLKQLMKFYEEL